MATCRNEAIGLVPLERTDKPRARAAVRPWRDLSSFKAHWLRNCCSGSWQARRDLLNELFAPVQAELDRQEEAQFRAVNAEAVSPHTKTGWPTVDEELTELRRRFRTATTKQDYHDVGNRTVGVLEALSCPMQPHPRPRGGLRDQLNPDNNNLALNPGGLTIGDTPPA